MVILLMPRHLMQRRRPRPWPFGTKSTGEEQEDLGGRTAPISVIFPSQFLSSSSCFVERVYRSSRWCCAFFEADDVVVAAVPREMGGCFSGHDGYEFTEDFRGSVDGRFEIVLGWGGAYHSKDACILILSRDSGGT